MQFCYNPLAILQQRVGGLFYTLVVHIGSRKRQRFAADCVDLPNLPTTQVNRPMRLEWRHLLPREGSSFPRIGARRKRFAAIRGSKQFEIDRKLLK